MESCFLIFNMRTSFQVTVYCSTAYLLDKYDEAFSLSRYALVFLKVYHLLLYHLTTRWSMESTSFPHFHLKHVWIRPNNSGSVVDNNICSCFDIVWTNYISYTAKTHRCVHYDIPQVWHHVDAADCASNTKSWRHLPRPTWYQRCGAILWRGL